jgi:hypothetical protein
MAGETRFSVAKPGAASPVMARPGARALAWRGWLSTAARILARHVEVREANVASLVEARLAGSRPSTLG